ncbi:MAG: PqqD family protein [Vicinamibacteria bacterium]
MDKTSCFEVSPDVVATDFEGKEAVVLNLATKKYYTLNETATAIWSGLEEKRPVDGLVELLTSQFEVTPERARVSVIDTLERLKGQKLIQVCP